jgi:transposase InsO family protein
MAQTLAGRTGPRRAAEQVLQGHSRARKSPPAKTHPLVVEQILAIRDQPPEGLRRVPGQETIRYYLEREPMLQFFQLPVPSCKTMYRVLKTHGRIAEQGRLPRQPLERPAPMSAWQIDLKDISTVGPDPAGKQQHVVESLNIIDRGTSVLIAAHVRADFTAETALEALALTLAKQGCPKRMTLDRDSRWVGSPAGSDFPAALVRFCACVGIEVQIRIIPSKTASSSAITARITRNVSPPITPPTWSKPKRLPQPSSSTTTSSARIKASRVAIDPPAPLFLSCPPYPPYRRQWIRTAGWPRWMGCIWSGIRGSQWQGQH